MISSLKRLIPERHWVRLLWHRGKSFCAAFRYGFPARHLRVIGVTGTDGKTTTVAMIAHILNGAGMKGGALSTAFFLIGDDTTWNATQKTSPSPFLIQHFLRRLVNAGCTHAILEYSSHGLVQRRLDWTWPAVAAITNTTPEHLDYHDTMEQYRKDKALLFKMIRHNGAKILNLEDDSYELLEGIATKRTLSYGGAPLPDEDRGSEEFFWVSDVHVEPLSTEALLHRLRRGPHASSEEEASLVLQVPGLFNVENALCAIAASCAAGVPFQTAVAALSSFTGVPGRMEKIHGPQEFSVYVDFTVTPAAYEKTLNALRKILSPGKRLLVLTGSCGDRMREKRPQIGHLCSTLADVVIVTNEDPYTEDPEKIIDEVWAGIDGTAQAHRISDRREAIQFILSQAQPGDIVLLCGKGSDTTMWVREGQIPWNERAIVREYLQAAGRGT